MSRSLQSPAPAVERARSEARSGGRHRVDRVGGLRAIDLPGVGERLTRREQDRNGSWSTVWRWLTAGTPAGRHTWSFLAGNGGRPRTAFAIILSL